jgi:ABC-type branched-subunit amino acid transport system permease subunit
MLVAIYPAMRTAGLVIQAALTHPQTVEALGHNVPRVFMLTFGGGSALAALAGAVGGPAFVTDPGMAAAIGPIVFVVVVVGGMGSLAGAFLASLLIGLLQTFSVSLEVALRPPAAARHRGRRRDLPRRSAEPHARAISADAPLSHHGAHVDRPAARIDGDKRNLSAR